MQSDGGLVVDDALISPRGTQAVVATAIIAVVPAPPVPLIADSIVVGHLQTYLDSATVVHPSTPARSALKALRQRNFDQAPVVEHDSPVGYVLARDLENTRGRVEAHVRPILPHALASEMSPLDEVLPWLDLTGFLFVLRGRTISGFVVPSDINRQAGRAYFYLALTALELELAETVRALHRTTDVLELLSAPAAGAVRKRLRERVDANVEADVVAEMTLSNLFQIIGIDGELLERLCVDSEADWRAMWTPINRLRLRVAHSTKPLLEVHDEFRWLVDTGSQVSALLARLIATRGGAVD